jgi:hypothetical protein
VPIRTVSVLTLALIGSLACMSNPTPEASTAGTTTSMSTADSTESTTSTSIETLSTSDTDDPTETSTATSDTNWHTHGDVGQSQCDPFVQADCPDGEKCVPFSTTGTVFDANKCVPVTGDGQPGDPCTHGGPMEGTDDCGADSICLVVGDSSVCTEFCQGTPDDWICPEGLVCHISHDGSITVCRPQCNPLLQDCGDGWACHFSYGFTCSDITENLPLGEPCQWWKECAPGLTCLSTDLLPDCADEECCASYCDLDAPICPQMGTECTPLLVAGMPWPGFENVGTCTLPP